MAFALRARRSLSGATVAAIVIVTAVTAVTGAPFSSASAAPVSSATADEVAVGSAPEQPADVAAITAPAGDQRLSFDVALAPRDSAALAQFVSSVSTRGSAQYRHYLRPGEFGPRFGASAATISQVTTALRQLGLTVGTPSSNGLSIPVTGTVTQVGNALHTSFRQYRLSSGRSGLLNVSAPKLPTSIAAQVRGVVGLDQLTHATARHAVVAAAPLAVAPVAAGPTPRSAATVRSAAMVRSAATPTACATVTTQATSTGAYTAPQIAHHYGLDSLYATDTGAGATVALFELEPFDPNDIAAYQACYGTQTAVSVQQVDGGAGTGTGSGEAALDIEQVIGLAPSAKLVVYEAPNDSASVYDEFHQIANDDAAQVVSDSWGLCEADTDIANLASLERPVLQQMAAQGQTVLAATGNSGSEGCYAPPTSNNTSLSVWDPASQPEVTAVGGTTVSTIDAADTSWSNGFGATGGGVSTLWPMPAYQRPKAVVADSTAAPCGALSGQLCREIPDVSASADVEHGSMAYYGGAWHAVGGTNAAAPIWGAIIALVDAQCSAGAVGFVNPSLYQLATDNATTVVDVATGPENDFTGSNPGHYATTAGYDLTTGLGRPSAAALAVGLCTPVGVAGSGTMTVNPTLVSTSVTTTLAFTYTPPNGDGMVDGELDLTVPGTWTLPTTTATTAGYTTASAGTTSVSGNTVVVRGITTAANKTITIIYGDTSGGAPGVETPSTAQATVFTAKSRADASGSTAALTISPAVRVLTPGAVGAGDAMLSRIAGVDRIATSIAASQAGFPTAGSAGAVVIARSDTYPDALAGVPLAAHHDGPLLLTPPSGLDQTVITEIQRVLPIGRQVFVLGSTASLPATVEDELRSLGYLPQRLQGLTRYETAVAIANALGNPSTVFEVDGTNFPDALSAGPAAVMTHGAVLFTAGHDPAPATTNYLATHVVDVRYAVGGPAADADPSAARLAGVDRYATSTLVAQAFFASPSKVGVASALVFPDALSGGPVTALAGGPVILVPPTGALPNSTHSYLSGIANSVLAGWLFGGPPSVSTTVADEVAQSLVLVPPSS